MSNSLVSWYQERTSRLFRVPPTDEEDQFVSDFDSVFSSTLQVTINGVETPRSEVAEHVHLQRATSLHLDLAWNDVIQVPKSAEDEGNSEGGIVAGQLIVTRSLKIRIRAAPAQNQTISVFQAFIEEDPGVTSGDRRRVVRLSEVVINKQVPINIGLPQTPSTQAR